MSKYDKIFSRINETPTRSDIKFSEIDFILTQNGFTCTQSSGGSSHFIYTYSEYGLQLTIVRHGNENCEIKKAYVKATHNALEELIFRINGGE